MLDYSNADFNIRKNGKQALGGKDDLHARIRGGFAAVQTGSRKRWYSSSRFGETTWADAIVCQQSRTRRPATRHHPASHNT